MTRRTGPSQAARICDAIASVHGGATLRDIRSLLLVAGAPQVLVNPKRPHLRLLLYRHRYERPGEDQLWFTNRLGRYFLTTAGRDLATSVPQSDRARKTTLEERG